MGPPSYIRSVVDRNVVIRRMTVLIYRNIQHYATQVRDVRNICYLVVSPHILFATHMIRAAPVFEYCSAKALEHEGKARVV